MSEPESTRGSESIAIVGMACLFPQAGSLQDYWDNIYTGRDCITDVPPSRWNVDDYYDSESDAPDKAYSKRGGFIPDTAFDPIEFGLPPNILEVTDTSQLLSLVVAKRALEDAGYGPKGGRPFDRERTGVVLGVGGGQTLVQPLVARLQYPVWEKVLRSSGLTGEETARIVDKAKKAYVPWEENSFPGLLGNVIAGRIANRFDLGGLNCVVDAACASSLAALEMAIGELAAHRVDMVIGGGVDTDNSIFMYMCFSKTPAFSHGDHLKPFDAESDGMMVGEGIGMLVLKRLSDAERDGDRIYAVIRGIGSSSDGRFKSIYAPRAEGQARALRRAHLAAQVAPEDVDLIEAHGTGTVAGDLVEASTLRQVFAADGSASPHVALGSVKSQIGHTKAAAGAAGLIKAALALHHKVLPPTINVSEPHPALDLGGSPLYLNTESRPWMPPAGGGPRRAGVSSFGFGGSNYHAVLEEYESEQTSSYRLQRVAQPVILSAPDPAALLDRCREVAARVEGSDEDFRRLIDETARERIPAGWARIGFIARSPADVAEQLRTAVQMVATRGTAAAWESPRGLHYRSRAIELDGAVVALFPGQGSQHLNMGRELAGNVPDVRRAFAAMDELFRRDGNPPLSAVVYPPPTFDRAHRAAGAERLQATACAQPAIGTLSAALFTMLHGAGFAPDFAAGHSFGELTALWAAGAFDREAFFALARARGRAMAPPSDPAFDAGCMLAVKGDAARIRAELGEIEQVWIANLNAPDQIVVAGPRAVMERARALLTERRWAVTPLPVSAAFHTPLVDHAQIPFARALADVELRAPRIPVYANSTGLPYPATSDGIRATLAAQLSQPVRFQEQIENLYAAGGRLFVECGPGTTLTGLVGRILGDRSHLAIAVNGGPRQDSDEHFREALVRLRVAGLPLNTTDEYLRHATPRPPERRASTILLSGSNYVSEKTRRAFEEALNDGYRIRGAESLSANGHEEMARPVPPPPHEEPVSYGSDDHRPVSGAPAPAAVSPGPADGALGVALEQFSRQQSESVRTHQQYLNNETEYIRSFHQIMQQQQALLLAPDRAALPPGVLESVSQSLAFFHQHQAETTQVHRQYLDYQAGFSQSLFSLLSRQPVMESQGPEPHQLAGTGQPASAPPALVATAPPSAGMPATGIPVQRPVAAQTMAPPPVLSVPPTTVVQPPAPSRAPSPPMAPGEGWTTPEPAIASHPQLTPASAPRADPVPVSSHQALNREEVSAGLLQIVSDKTGYPVETLELDMDMESDLGIDSIKRVEILGATQERFPDAPPLKPEELAERRTLAQIVDYVIEQDSTTQSAVSVSPAGADFSTAAAPWSSVHLQPLPPPDALELSLPAGYCCLLSDDGTALTPALARSLVSSGWRVVVLAPTPSSHPLPPGIARVEMPNGTESALGELLASVTAGQGAPGACLYLCPRADSPEAGEAAVRQAFLLAKLLQPSISAAASQDFGAFVAVTRLGGELSANGNGAGDGLSGAVTAGLSGLVKTLSLEWPGVFCRTIDLDPDIPAEGAAALIMAELHDPNRLLAEVGHGARGRVTIATGEARGAPAW